MSGKLKLKGTAIPHLFDCQPTRKVTHTSVRSRGAFCKRKHASALSEAVSLSEQEATQSIYIEVTIPIEETIPIEDAADAEDCRTMTRAVDTNDESMLA